MRSLLEKAIVHLLNEDSNAAESLFHQFMVERARQIHNSLRQGEDVALTEGWDDELGKEEYFADGDLEDLVDHDDEDVTDGEESPISGDEDEDDITGGMDDMDGMSDEGGEDADVSDRLEDIKDQLEDLTREFEMMMSELDVDTSEDGMGEDEDAMNDDDMDSGEDGMGEMDGMDDETGEGDEEIAPEHEEEVSEMDEMEEDEDLDDITESVIAELEKVLVGDMTTDGEEVGSGKKITQNQKSALTMKKANSSDASSKTLASKQSKHDGYERETPPVTPKPVKLKSRNKVNDTSGKQSDLKQVPKGGDAGALLNKDFAGIKKGNTKSPID